MARSTVSPQRRPISAFGLMPAAITTMSQSSVVPSLKASPVTLSTPEDLGGVLLEMDVDAHRLHAGLQDRAAGGVELHFHQMPGQVNDVHLAAVVDQSARRFQAQQAAADDGGAPALLGLRNDAVAVVDGAKAEDAGLDLAVRAVHAGHRRNERAAAGRDQQLVVALADAVLGDDDLGGPIDFGSPARRHAA